jgi:hypothetical protein
MARPGVADGGNGFKIWRVGANSRVQPTRDGPPAWGLSERLTTHRKKKACYEMLTSGRLM